MKNLVAVIGDNCDTTRSITHRKGPTFISCNSHKFNLAVKGIIESIQTIVTPVNNLNEKFILSETIHQTSTTLNLKGN